MSSGFLPRGARIALAGAFLALVPPALAASGRVTLEEGGVRRSALVVEFQRLKQGPRPAIIVLHGGSGSGSGVRRNLGLDDYARASGSVMVYPDAVEGRWTGNNPALTGLASDAVYIRALIEKLVAQRVADRQRIFILGVSTGGLMAIRMACTATDLFAGSAALVANMPKSLEGNCNPSRPIPFLLINGTADTLIPYEGGRITLPNRTTEVTSTDTTLGAFANAAACAPERSNEPFAHRDANDPTRAVLQRFAKCKAPVELIRIEGGGHRIPGRIGGGGGNASAGARNNDLDASKAVWDFFKRVGN